MPKMARMMEPMINFICNRHRWMRHARLDKCTITEKLPTTLPKFTILLRPDL